MKLLILSATLLLLLTLPGCVGDHKNSNAPTAGGTVNDQSGVVNLAGLKTDVDSLVKMNAALSQKIDTLTAGRDINYLPKEAVHLMLGIIGTLVTLATTIAGYAYKNALARERDTYALLMAAITKVNPNDTATLLKK